MSLPVHDQIPDGLNHRTGLKRLGLVPLGPPVAEYRFRTRKGYVTCDLYRASEVRMVDPVRVAAGVQAVQTRKVNETAQRKGACTEAERDALKLYRTL
ncbi:hypothetical protein [Deinococcus sp. QL22]|uniref:hypothetical protein n=1 Tax=Deinococcus sp. QL22 TaxID=2939437 RepID=UPI002017A7D4|nr:hypothetical protein [Deinococcus sp. QL22]UQN09339.1 hypothetical protein M1R55_22500 [Deinococcus sp. QL22]